MDHDKHANPGPPIDSRPGKLGGATCFAGTRTPIDLLFNHLAAGGSLDEFQRGYDWIPREHLTGVLQLAGQDLVRPHTLARLLGEQQPQRPRELSN